MLIRRLLPIVSLFALVSCGSDGPGANTNLSGSMAFTFTGAGGGSFNVSGAAPALSANFGSANWAAGHREPGANLVQVIGVRTRSAGRYDGFFLGIARTTVGTESVDADCDAEAGENCSGFVFITNISETDSDFDFFCVALTGTIAISSISGDRVEGTFTGTGECFTETGVVSSFSVTGGTFNVRLLSATQLPQ